MGVARSKPGPGSSAHRDKHESHIYRYVQQPERVEVLHDKLSLTRA